MRMEVGLDKQSKTSSFLEKLEKSQDLDFIKMLSTFAQKITLPFS
jgi:hypothetical protein